MGTDTYEAVNTYEEAADLHEETHRGKGGTSARQTRLNTESTTDLSMDCYNYSDEDGDITHSCSDTEASFFIPHNDRREKELERRRPSMGDVGLQQDLQKAQDKEAKSKEREFRIVHLSTSFMGDVRLEQELQKAGDKEPNSKDKKHTSTSRRCESASQESSTNSVSLLNKSQSAKSSKRISSRSSMSQDSLEEQFEQTLRMISQAEFYDLDSENLDNLSTSAFE